MKILKTFKVVDKFEVGEDEVLVEAYKIATSKHIKEELYTLYGEKPSVISRRKGFVIYKTMIKCLEGVPFDKHDKLDVFRVRALVKKEDWYNPSNMKMLAKSIQSISEIHNNQLMNLENNELDVYSYSDYIKINPKPNPHDFVDINKIIRHFYTEGKFNCIVNDFEKIGALKAIDNAIISYISYKIKNAIRRTLYLKDFCKSDEEYSQILYELIYDDSFYEDLSRSVDINLCYLEEYYTKEEIKNILLRILGKEHFDEHSLIKEELLKLELEPQLNVAVFNKLKDLKDNHRMMNVVQYGIGLKKHNLSEELFLELFLKTLDL